MGFCAKDRRNVTPAASTRVASAIDGTPLPLLASPMSPASDRERVQLAAGLFHANAANGAGALEDRYRQARLRTVCQVPGNLLAKGKGLAIVTHCQATKFFNLLSVILHGKAVGLHGLVPNGVETSGGGWE